MAYQPRVRSDVTRAFDTAYQISLIRDSFVNYTVSISCTISLITGQAGAVYLETSPDNSSWTTVGQVLNANTGALTIGLNLTNLNSGSLFGLVPLGYWVRMRTALTTGTPTIAYLQGTETLL